MKRAVVGVLFALALLPLAGEEIWDTDWNLREAGEYFWRKSSVPLKDVPGEAWINLSKQISYTMYHKFRDFEGRVYAMGMFGWYGLAWNCLMNNEHIEDIDKAYDELMELERSASHAYLRLVLRLGADPYGLIETESSEATRYLVSVLKAAAMLAECVEILCNGYEAYVIGDGYGSQSAVNKFTSEDTYRLAVMGMNNDPAGMLGYVLYVLEGQETSERLRKHWLMEETYAVLDSLLDFLGRDGCLFVMIKDSPVYSRDKIDERYGKTAGDTSGNFVPAAFPFK